MSDYETTREQMEAQAGRPLTDDEYRNAEIAPAYDSRSETERIAAHNWRPSTTGNPSKFDRLRGQVQTQQNPYAGLSEPEALLKSIDMAEASQAAKQAAAETREQHRERYAEKRARVAEILAAEKLSPNSDAAFRDHLSRSLVQLDAVNGDPLATHNMLSHIDGVLKDRKAAKHQQLAKQREEIEAELAANLKQDQELTDDHPRVEFEKSDDPVRRATRFLHAMRARPGYPPERLAALEDAYQRNDFKAVQTLINRYGKAI